MLTAAHGVHESHAHQHAMPAHAPLPAVQAHHHEQSAEAQGAQQRREARVGGLELHHLTREHGVKADDRELRLVHRHEMPLALVSRLQI